MRTRPENINADEAKTPARVENNTL